MKSEKTQKLNLKWGNVYYNSLLDYIFVIQEGPFFLFQSEDDHIHFGSVQIWLAAKKRHYVYLGQLE